MNLKLGKVFLTAEQRQPGGRLDEIHAATRAIGGRNSHAPNQLLMLTVNPIRW
jgi:hypothetical protein